MECKGSICKGQGVLEASREADRAVTKEDIKEVIKEVTAEDLSEAHRAMVTVDIIRATASMEVTRTIITNNTQTRNKEEEARANLGLSGERGCIAWPNTGRLVA